MKDLIKALQIFLKYSNEKWPTQCKNDILRVYVDPNVVSEKDRIKLEELTFIPDRKNGRFVSYRFGSP